MVSSYNRGIIIPSWFLLTSVSALKISTDIEDQIEQELSKLNSQYSAAPGYRMHDSR